MYSENSNEFKILIERPQNLALRMGQTIIFIILLIFILFSWIIRIPESIVASVKIVSTNARTIILAKSTGSLFLNVQDREFVDAGQRLGIIKVGEVELSQVFTSLNFIDTIQENDKLIYSDTVNFDELYCPTELKYYFDDFNSKRKIYLMYINNNWYESRKQELMSKLLLLNAYEKQYKIEEELLEEYIRYEDRNFEINSSLFRDSIIPTIEYNKIRQFYIKNKLELQSHNSKFIETSILKQDLTIKINELDLNWVDDSLRMSRDLNDAFGLFISQLRDWESKYIIKSPISGKVTLGEFWSNGQTVTVNDRIMSIVPLSEGIFCLAFVPIERAGEIKEGQMVRISLSEYPRENYGTVMGTVKNISPATNNNFYFTVVDLPKPLVSSYNIQIPFSSELTGIGEIITKKPRIMEKVFNKFKHFKELVSSDSTEEIKN